MIKVVINCETNESQEVEMSDEEVSALKLAESIRKQREEEELALIAAEAAARESARAKLAALGLTEEEVAALIK